MDLRTADRPDAAAAGVRKGTALSPAGKATAKRIIDAARDLITERGNTQFSMRNVAEHAGLHLANVQYYFPRRDDLVHALFIDTAERYQAAYEKCLATAPDDPFERFKIILRYNMRDVMNRKTRQFFIQLWPLLESLDGHTGRLLREFYAIDIAQLGELISQMNPTVPRDEIERRATLLAAFIEGLLVVHVAQSGRKSDRDALIEHAFAVGLSIANGAGSTKPTA